MLADNLARVEERIAFATARAGRQRDQITLIAVSKVFPAQALRTAYELGLRHFGENYVQELQGKQPQVADLSEATFHLIGHLQSNKAKTAATLFQVVQTVDSEKLARRLDEAGQPLRVMIAVKLSQEESKQGAAPEQIPKILQTLRTAQHLRVTGLMTLPPWSDNPEESRPYFARLRELATVHGLPMLSMGMSHDLEVAIEEGATHIRVGTALFGRRKPA